MSRTYRLNQLTLESHEVLLAALAAKNPKGKTEFVADAECVRAFRDARPVGKSALDKNYLELSEAAFKFLQEAFKEAVDGGRVYTGLSGPGVIMAFEVMEQAEKQSSPEEVKK